MKTLEDFNLHRHPKSRGASVPIGNGSSSFWAHDGTKNSCPSGRMIGKQHPSGRKLPVGLPSEPHVCEKRTLPLHWMTSDPRRSAWWWQQRPDPSVLPSACCSNPCASPPSCITQHSDNWIVYNIQTAWEEKPMFSEFSNEPWTNTFVIYNFKNYYIFKLK